MQEVDGEDELLRKLVQGMAADSGDEVVSAAKCNGELVAALLRSCDRTLQFNNTELTYDTSSPHTDHGCIVAAIIGVSAFRGAGLDKLSAMAGEKPVSNATDEAETHDDRFSPHVDLRGEIILLRGYRTKWAHSGSWAVAKKSDGRFTK